MVTESPGWCAAIRSLRPEADDTASPPTAVITSPAVRPAWAAGDPETTPATVAPDDPDCPFEPLLLP